MLTYCSDGIFIENEPPPPHPHPSRPHFNIKMSYRLRKYNCGDRLSYDVLSPQWHLLYIVLVKQHLYIDGLVLDCIISIMHWRYCSLA